MICNKCNTNNIENAKYCSSCGNSLIKPQEQFNNQVYNQVQPLATQDTNTKSKKKHVFLKLLILIILILGGIYLYNTLTRNNNKDDDNIYVNNSLTKIKNDYQNKKLNANEYLTQLYYLEYEEDKLDKKYKPNEGEVILNDNTTIEFILDNYDKLDKDIVNKYLYKYTLQDVVLGEDTESNDTNSIKNEIDGVDEVKNHVLNSVKLSKNNHFIIFYANSGADKTSEEAIDDLQNGLEDTISIIEQIYDIEYTYDPYVDNKIANSDWKNAKKLLTANNIDPNIVKTAMSVYVYDFNSDVTLGRYEDEQYIKKILNRTIYLDTLSGDGIINYPHITINQASVDNMDKLAQVYRHELFHHFQHIFTKPINKSGDYSAPKSYSEAMANLASLLTSDRDGDLLNGWASYYKKRTYTIMDMINEDEGYGYALFVYFYSYLKNNDNWVPLFKAAHDEVEPYKYIQDNTSKEVLINTINYVAYHTLSNSFDKVVLNGDFELHYYDTLEKGYNKKAIVKQAAVNYYSLTKDTKLNIYTKNNNYISFILYGRKDNTYEQLAINNSVLEFDTSNYKDYDEFYLAVTNANLLNESEYNISVSKFNEVEEPTKENDFITDYDNYNIEITLNTKIAGIELYTHSTGIVDEKNQTEYLETETTTEDITVETKMYIDNVNGYSYTAPPIIENYWIKNEYKQDTIDIKKILEDLNNNKNVKKINDNHYELTIKKKEINDTIPSSNPLTIFAKKDVVIDIYTEDKYITKIDYDLSEVYTGIEVMKATVVLSNYNNAGDVIIPDYVLEQE